MQFDGNPGAGQTQGKCNVLFQKQIQRANGQKRRWPVTQIVLQGRRKPADWQIIQRLVSAQAIPAELVGLRWPANHAGRAVLVRRGCAARTVIEHRINQHLTGDGILAAIPRHNGQRCCQPGAGTVAHDDYFVGVNIERLLVGENPAEGRVAILQRNREGVLWRETVIDGDDDRLKCFCEVSQIVIGHFGATKDETSTMDVQDHRKITVRCCGGGPVKTQAQILTVVGLYP